MPAGYGAAAYAAPLAPPSAPDTGFQGVLVEAKTPNLQDVPEEMRAEVAVIQDRILRGQRWSTALGFATLAMASLAIACGVLYYARTVLCYALVNPEIQLLRDPADPERVSLVYAPTSSGKIRFSRADAERETQLLDRILPDAVGKKQHFQWRVTGLKTGDLVRVTYLEGLRLTTQEFEVPDVSAGPRLGDGILSGQIVNAVNNQPVSDAEVRIQGTPLVARTDATGRFRIDGAPIGPQRIEVLAKGFSADYLERDLVAGKDEPWLVALNPGLEQGQLRIVLTWNSEPKDIDAHLEGPLPDNARFHVYYHQQGDLKSREFVRLDVDNREGHGPETITVLGVLPGTYRYFVHDYSSRDDAQSTALSSSGAEVRVYHGGQTYRFQAKPGIPGNIWDVCTIEVTPQGADVKSVDQYKGVKLSSLGLYDKRTQANRQDWIARYGGSAASENAVREGLEWLARHQAADGSWHNGCLGTGTASRCDKAGPCADPGERYEMGHTGLALLAFQAGGHYYFNAAPFSPVVRKGLDWMVDHQGPNGELVSAKPPGGYTKYHKHHMYEHGIAAFALADAVAAAAAQKQPADPRYAPAARKAIAFIQQSQHADGGWRYSIDKAEASDTSVSGWQVLALKSAREADIQVDNLCIQKIRKFFQSRETGENGRTGYDNRLPQTDATTGIGMMVRQFLLGEADSALVRDAAQYLAGLAEQRWGGRTATEDNRDFYLWYNCTLGMFQAGGKLWEKWNSIVRDTILSLQCHDGCHRGSWDPKEQWGQAGGRIYSTALAILTLEVYYRYTRADEIAPTQLDRLHAQAPDAAAPAAAAKTEPSDSVKTKEATKEEPLPQSTPPSPKPSATGPAEKSPDGTDQGTVGDDSAARPEKKASPPRKPAPKPRKKDRH